MKKKAALLQMRPEWASPEVNRKQVEQLVSRAMEEAEDILVLPELWDTGFFPSENLDSLADVDGCKARNFLSEMARRYRVNIVGGSVLVKEGNCYYNRAYVVNRSGQVTAEYDKVHGFSPAGEQKLFTGGNHTVHFLLDDIPCSMAICYDIRFPEFIRREALEGAKLFFVPAAWPLRRIEHWKILNQARAIENEMVVLAVNQAGLVNGTMYGGGSMAVTPLGTMRCLHEEENQILRVEFDMNEVDKARQSIQVYRDRRIDMDRL